MISIVVDESHKSNNKTICPTCNKAIEPRFSIKKQTGQKAGGYWDVISLLGCPECKSVFYKEYNIKK